MYWRWGKGRCPCQEAEERGRDQCGGYGSGWCRSNKAARFWLGRQASFKNGLVRRPLFSAVAEWLFVDEDASADGIRSTSTFVLPHRIELCGSPVHRDTGSAVDRCYGPLQASYVGSVMACEVRDDVDLGSFEDDFWDASLQALFEIERDVSSVRQCEGSRSSSPLQVKGEDVIADEGPGLIDVVDMVRIRSAFVGLGDDISPYWTRAIEHANQQAVETVSLAFPGTTTFRLIAYGYFGRDHGSRQVDLPIGALSDWDRHAKNLWSEIAPSNLMRAAHLRPQHVLVAGVLTLRVLVSTDFAAGWAICAVECVLGVTETVHLCKVPHGVSGYGLLRVVDVPFWGHVIIKKNGVIVRGSDRIDVSDGEVIRALVDDDAEGFSSLQTSRTVHGSDVSVANSRCDELL